MPKRKSDTLPVPVAGLGIPFAHDRVNSKKTVLQGRRRQTVGMSWATVPLFRRIILHAEIVQLFCRSFVKSADMRRNRRPPFLASLSVLAMLPLVGSAVQAASSTTAQETTQLARAYAVDLRCRVLSAADGDDLARYLLNAQALLARQSSLKQAQAAVAEGKATAAGSLCTADDKSLVVSTLAEVRRAGTAVAEQAKKRPPYNAREPMEFEFKDSPPAELSFPKPTLKPEIEPAPEARAATTVQPKKIKPAKSKTSARKVKKKRIVERVPANSNAKAAQPRRKPEGLRQYGNLAETYYVALKCRSVSYEQAMRLYGRVIKSHRAAVAAYPAFEVRAILRAAKAKADLADCD